jgi:hypothetical protein
LQVSTFFRWHQYRHVYLLTITYLVSRIVFRFAGVVFYGEFVKRLWQAIDVELLKTSLIESLYYAHAQPPLFNLLSGIVLKIFPNHYDEVFHLLFLIIGWLNVLVIYFSLRKLKVSETFGFIVAIIFMMLPSVVLYENLYSYTYVNVFLLSFSIYLLLYFVDNRKIIYWFLFCSTLCCLVLLRSFYHVSWLVVIVAIALYFFRRERSFPRLVVVSIIPMLFVLGWLIKNLLLFGSFSTSTWVGMNLARVMPPTTELGKVGPFKSIDHYRNFKTCIDYADVKLLHEVYKSNSGFVNYFHIDYIQVSNAFAHDVFLEVRSDPVTYVRRVVSAFIIYCSPASHAPFIDKNYNHLSEYASVIDLNFTGYEKFEKEHFPVVQAIPILLLHLILVAALVYCFQKRLFTKETKFIVIVMMAIIGYSIIVGTLFEYGENNRFRFEHLTVFLLLLVKTVDTIYTSRFRRNYS